MRLDYGWFSDASFFACLGAAPAGWPAEAPALPKPIVLPPGLSWKPLRSTLPSAMSGDPVRIVDCPKTTGRAIRPVQQ